METKRTEVTKHYWNNEGVYDKEFTQMTETLMKATGQAYTSGVKQASTECYQSSQKGIPTA